MNKETLEQAKNLERQIDNINYKLIRLKNDNLKLCAQYSNGTIRDFMAIDDETKEFIKCKLKTELKTLKKELEEL